MLSETKIEKKFTRFSDVLIKKCTTESQKQKALGISKILWLLLVRGQDTEENVYSALFEILKDHESTISFVSLYFYEMKSKLRKVEIKQLRNHYSDSERFQELSDWLSEFH
uniref:Uncharacterized protein n=1 Tax=Candidatus Kentrum sp. DK TaxID=2126562 RepID=A0A450RZZ2_9GAMM|nr:MAG: hypothetical protein BECKDK2373C_GA0170839_100917 [Candidatus Kentron sp. DK]VFJ44854.1 MAG: hypothetical protein BECKDK2373B_GA0170837_100827 [Candidatus Kentron sp. DK]